MKQICKMIYDGARAYLLTQYKWLSVWVACMFFVLMLIIGVPSNSMADGVFTAICFLIGSAFSALAGWLGMQIATQANGRTAQACTTSISRGLEVSFASGAVMGNAVVGLGLLGLCSLYLIFTYASAGSDVAAVSIDAVTSTVTLDWSLFSGVFNRLAGFGFGE